MERLQQSGQRLFDGQHSGYDMLEIREAAPGKGGKAPSRDFVAQNITKVAKAAGLQHKKLTSHSFRGGAATHAIRQGVDSGKIMLAIRWKSFQGFKSYIEPSPL
ncbi:hypothetical protein OSTOST_01988 [Ostertagia ostertagi]